MKKFLLLSILSFSATIASAQIYFVGIKAGPTLSNYKTKTPWKEASNVGYTFGFVGYKQINANIGIGAEVQYIQKGYFHKVCKTITDKLKAQYLEIPILVDYTLSFRGWTTSNYTRTQECTLPIG
jgi:hypothetical protein